MNILFLAPRLPLPADTGGKIRTLNILKQLAKENSVCLVCFSFEESDKNEAEALKSLGIEVHMVPMVEPSLLQKITMVLFNQLPFSIWKYESNLMVREIKRLLVKNTYDAIHFDHLHMAIYRHCFNNIPCFLDEHNVECKILDRCAEVETILTKRALYQQQYEKMLVFESQRIREFNGVFACSSDDGAILNDLAEHQATIHVIPNGVDTQYFDFDEKSEMEEALVFTGSMDWLPNNDAIGYFCNEILPLVWKHKPALKLYVVGKNPSKQVKKLAQTNPQVIVTGRVDDVRPYVKKAKVFIVPLRIGGGTRLKILEAMAMGKAVVSTTIGAEGIECKDGVHIAIADTPADFASKIIELCNQLSHVASMGHEGRDLVCQKYDWSIVGKKLNAIYNEAAHASR